MRHRDLIAPKVQRTPLSDGGTRKTTREIPDDLLKEASRRLEIMSLLAAVLWTVGSILWHVRADSGSGDLHLYPYESSDNIAVFAVIASLAVYLYLRTTTRDSKVILNIGLGYMVLMATAIGLIGHWYTNPVDPDMSVNPTVSWIGVLLLIFAAVIPGSPRKIVIAGVVAASMGPVGMLIAKARGVWDFGPSIKAFLMHSPDFVLIGAAVVIARVLSRLGQQVSKARELGSYRLGGLLKRGGMGEIYKATHTMLARPAAIKLIRPEMLGGDNGDDDAQLAVTRFHREAEAAANLRSPHTVELFDFGVTEDQTLYFVMEMLEGMDLDTMVQKHGPLPPTRVIHILRQTCESLGEAHARGLVHRDIKPANIHVGHVGIHDDFVKVLDFGLVKSFSTSSQVSLETAVGRTPGTPAYMAPEMALGETVDGRADIYALGCVAYYLLTGKLVFDAENTFQMVAKHLHHNPVPPSVRGEVAIPEQLERLVLKCLAKTPAERPATAAELSRALADINVDPWTEEQAREWWNIHNAAPVSHSEISGVRT